MLEYMRTDVSIGGQQVLAVVLSDVSTALIHPIAVIWAAIEKGNYGHRNVTKDFLDPGCHSTTVTRGVNNRRRKCVVILLSKIDFSREQLKSGK